MCVNLATTLNSLPRTAFIFLIFYSILFLYLIRENDATDDDEKWSAVHGNVPLTSGMWDYLWTISEDEIKLKNISYQAHRRCFDKIPNITWANASIRELFFPDNFNFQPIKLDVIMYTVAGRYHDKIPWYYFLTKGVRDDCVYYVMPMTTTNFRELHLTPDQVCGMNMPPRGPVKKDTFEISDDDKDPMFDPDMPPRLY